MSHNHLEQLKTLLIIAVVLSCEFFLTNNVFSESLTNLQPKNYKAVVLGKITKKKVKKLGTYYYTEYKLKTEKWLFKSPGIKEGKNLKIKILGAELPEKGVVIKSSTAPDFVPVNKKAIFFIEEMKKKEKGVFTVSRNGIIYGEQLKSFKLAEFAEAKKEI